MCIAPGSSVNPVSSYVGDTPNIEAVHYKICAYMIMTAQCTPAAETSIANLFNNLAQSKTPAKQKLGVHFFLNRW